MNISLILIRNTYFKKRVGESERKTDGKQVVVTFTFKFFADP